MTFTPKGMLSAYSAPLSGTTATSLVITGTNSALGLTVFNRVVLTNLTAETVYFTVDGSTPTTAGTNCFILAPIAGYQRAVGFPTFGSQEAAEAYYDVNPITLTAVGSAAWSIFVEGYQ